MKGHINILVLLDYAQGKISDETQHDHITDHLCECEFCQQILKSHYYLIHNHDILLEKFFPKLDPVAQKKTIETAKQKEFPFSPASLIQTISDKITTLRKQGAYISREIKIEISKFLDEIKSLPDLEELLVPLKVENITLLGEKETDKLKEQQLKYLSRNIKLYFLPFLHFKIEDFAYSFAGKFFYVIYEKENFKELKDRKINLITDIGSPFIFTATFKETHNSVSARFKLEFEEILPFEDSVLSKENDHEFLLRIE
jgi:hypothetical protein